MIVLLLGLAHASTGDPYAGEWTVALSEAEAQQVLEDAIDASAKQFNVLIRGIAKGKLRNAAFVCHRIALGNTEAAFSADCLGDDKEGITAPWSGASVPGTNPVDGAAYQATVRREGDAPQLVLTNGEGERRSTYVLNGDALELRVQVFSSRLDSPLTWTLPYTRVP